MSELAFWGFVDIRMTCFLQGVSESAGAKAADGRLFRRVHGAQPGKEAVHDVTQKGEFSGNDLVVDVPGAVPDHS